MSKRSIELMRNYQSIPDASSSAPRRQKAPILEEKATSPLAKLYVLAPLLIITTITVASLFYKFYHNWEMSTCVYYACQILIGVMYGVPAETDRYSQMFSLLLYFLGATYIYAAIAAYANIITERAVASSKDVARMDNVTDLDGDGVLSCGEWMTFIYNRILSAMNWNQNKYYNSYNLRFVKISHLLHTHRYAIITVGTTVAWLLLGIVYGLFWEGYDLYTAVYFALGTYTTMPTPLILSHVILAHLQYSLRISAITYCTLGGIGAMMLAGSVAPPCVGEPSNCSLGTPRAIFMAIYLVVGRQQHHTSNLFI
jgi:hypothetical protein